MNKATIKYINDIIDDFNQRFPNKDFRILEVGEELEEPLLI